MKIDTILRTKALPFLAVLVLTLISFRSAPAATHTIKFGGDLGLAYSPNVLQVAVGDVITWEGDFAMHPLHFEIVPAGATTPADVTSGTTFSYTVEAVGDYGYWCNFHFSAGMVGGFQAGITEGVDQPIDTKMLSLAPNPLLSTQTLNVQLGFDASKIERISLIDMNGHSIILTPASYELTGSSLTIDPASFVAGAYILSIEADRRIYRRKLIVK